MGLAEGANALCIITNPMTPELLDRYHELGVRGIATRSIGYDHIDVEHARRLGIRVAHAAYPPEGVADYAIMLMLMALRKVKFVQRCAAAQDFSLEGKIGRSLGSCTVGVVGTGAIGSCVVRELQGLAVASSRTTRSRRTSSPGSSSTWACPSCSPRPTW